MIYTVEWCEMERKQRKLTASEQKRKLQFDKLSAQLVADGYKRYDLTVDMVKVSFIALAVMLPFVGIAVALYFAVNGAQGLNGAFKELLLFVAVTVAFIFVHEGIHGLVWAICCRSFKAISFGIIVRTLTPYCTCARPLKKWQYIAGAAMPTLLLGVGLTALAVITSRLWLLITAVTLIFGGGGDFYVVFRLFAFKSKKKTLYCDHPYECGTVVFEEIGK